MRFKVCNDILVYAISTDSIIRFRFAVKNTALWRQQLSIDWLGSFVPNRRSNCIIICNSIETQINKQKQQHMEIFIKTIESLRLKDMSIVSNNCIGDSR